MSALAHPFDGHSPLQGAPYFTTVVRLTGVEPAWVSPLVSKTSMYTSPITSEDSYRNRTDVMRVATACLYHSAKEPVRMAGFEPTPEASNATVRPGNTSSKFPRHESNPRSSDSKSEMLSSTPLGKRPIGFEPMTLTLAT